MRWAPVDCPVSVYLDAALIEPDVNPFALALNATRWLRLAGVRVLQLPVVPEREMRALFDTSRDTIQGAILIRAVRIHPGTNRWKCTTDMRWDKRTGFFRNGVVDWLMVGDPDVDAASLAHELGGHCLGLDHQAGTVMAAKREDQAGQRWLSGPQIAKLLQVYGPPATQ